MPGETGIGVRRRKRAVSGAGEGFYSGASVDVASRDSLNAARAKGGVADGGEQIL